MSVNLQLRLFDWVFTIKTYWAVWSPTLSQGWHLRKPKMFVGEQGGQLPPVGYVHAHGQPSKRSISRRRQTLACVERLLEFHRFTTTDQQRMESMPSSVGVSGVAFARQICRRTMNSALLSMRNCSKVILLNSSQTLHCGVVDNILVLESIGHGFKSEHRLFSHHVHYPCSLDDSLFSCCISSGECEWLKAYQR